MLQGGFITEDFSKVFCPKNFLPFLGGKQEGNGPIDSRAMVMASDSKSGPIFDIRSLNYIAIHAMHRPYLKCEVKVKRQQKENNS